jgi:hypothetical protein
MLTGIKTKTIGLYIIIIIIFSPHTFDLQENSYLQIQEDGLLQYMVQTPELLTESILHIGSKPKEAKV